MREMPMFVLVGPSAYGKSTVAQMLVEQFGMKRAVTTTTRKRRRGEPADAYHFVSKESFSADDMVESQEYASNYYGLSKAEADGSNLVILEPKGAMALRSYCGARGCYVVGIQVSRKAQAERMVMRGDSAKVINERIAFDAVAFQNFERVCDTVCSADTVEELCAIIKEYINAHMLT